MLLFSNFFRPFTHYHSLAEVLSLLKKKYPKADTEAGNKPKAFTIQNANNRGHSKREIQLTTNLEETQSSHTGQQPEYMMGKQRNTRNKTGMTWGTDKEREEKR